MPQDRSDDNAIRHLIPRLSRRHHEYIRKAFAKMGLYSGQGNILMQLWRQDGLTPTQLCQPRRITPSTMTRTLQRMEKGGWIVRNQDVYDRRVTRVHLTEAGRAAEQKVDQINRDLEQQILAGMTTEERIVLRRLLLLAIENIEDVPEP